MPFLLVDGAEYETALGPKFLPTVMTSPTNLALRKRAMGRIYRRTRYGGTLRTNLGTEGYLFHNLIPIAIIHGADQKIKELGGQLNDLVESSFRAVRKAGLGYPPSFPSGIF